MPIQIYGTGEQVNYCIVQTQDNSAIMQSCKNASLVTKELELKDARNTWVLSTPTVYSYRECVPVCSIKLHIITARSGPAILLIAPFYAINIRIDLPNGY